MSPKFVCACVCVSTPEATHITSGVILTLNDWLNNCSCFSVSFYGSCHVDVIGRHGPGNEMRRQLQPKNQDNAIYIAARHFSRPPLVTKQSALVLTVGVSYGWQSISKEDWFTCCVNNYKLCTAVKKFYC